MWTETGFAYEFWCRHLAVFDQVAVVARFRQIPMSSPKSKRADGPGVCFVPVSYYLGVQQYVMRLPQIRRSVKNVVEPTDAVILRVGSQVAHMVERQLRRTDYPLALEVAGDPARMIRMSARNLVEAPEYRNSTLKERRDAFYSYVKEFTLKRQKAGSMRARTRKV